MNKAWTVLPPRYAKICSWHALLVSDHHDQDLNWPTTKNLFMTCTPSLWSSRSRLGLTYYESPGAEQEILSLGPKASPRSGAGMEQCWLGSARTAFCDLSCRTSVVACPVTVALKNKNKISHFQLFFFLFFGEWRPLNRTGIVFKPWNTKCSAKGTAIGRHFGNLLTCHDLLWR